MRVGNFLDYFGQILANFNLLIFIWYMLCINIFLFFFGGGGKEALVNNLVPIPGINMYFCVICVFQYIIPRITFFLTDLPVVQFFAKAKARDSTCHGKFNQLKHTPHFLENFQIVFNTSTSFSGFSFDLPNNLALFFGIPGFTF